MQEGTRELVELLPRVVRGIRRSRPSEMEELMQAGQLGPRHAATLHLLRGGPRTVGELAGQLELSLATTSNLVAELARAGLAERHQDPADRRRTIVSIVEERRQAIETWLAEAGAALERALARLSALERATFVKALRVLDEELGRPTDAPGRRGRR